MLMRRMAAEVDGGAGAHRRAHAVQLKTNGVDVVIGLQAKQVVQSVRSAAMVISREPLARIGTPSG